MTTPDFDALARKNQRTGLIVLVVVGMVGLSFAAVPMYRLFCRVTGFGGPTQIAAPAPAPGAVTDRIVTVQFNADISPALPWVFAPDQRSVRLKVGEEGLAAYHARNETQTAVTGTAVYNVSPPKAGKYFHKTQCFCFAEQTLTPGQDITMPVVFYVDPEFASDPDMEDVSVITLSYTFYKAETKELEKAMEAYGNE